MAPGEGIKIVTCWKLKNLHSCLVPTSRGTAACEAVVLSWLTRSIWPAPLETERATAHRETHTHIHQNCSHHTPRERNHWYFRLKQHGSVSMSGPTTVIKISPSHSVVLLLNSNIEQDYNYTEIEKWISSVFPPPTTLQSVVLVVETVCCHFA